MSGVVETNDVAFHNPWTGETLRNVSYELGEHAGLQWAIVRTVCAEWDYTVWFGYVQVPEGHPWYGVRWTQVDKNRGMEAVGYAGPRPGRRQWDDVDLASEWWVGWRSETDEDGSGRDVAVAAVEGIAAAVRAGAGV